ncbi:hypothetical protein ACKW6Q_08455 [Chryseobacterium kwangjuense]|uniref:Uncharacterized protein n=1 Tax=Chryseobacterium kwangjuense TaxID=267125 RepID=A0ABW9K1G6_9FLAO
MMISTLQENEIVQYLVSKKLDQKLMAEIKDHFMLQIMDLMEEDNISFQDAFLQTKMNWKYELEMVKADILSAVMISRIEKNILQDRFRKMMGYAVMASILVSVLLYIRQDLFMDTQMAVLGIICILSGYNFIFRKMNLFHYTQISFHPLMLKNLLAGAILIAVSSIFFENFREAFSVIIKPFFLYSAAIQIQLLYWKARKVNVLL